MQTKRVLRVVAVSVVVCIMVGGIALGAILWNIHQSVQEYCALAEQAHAHAGDDVGALIAYMNSERHTLRERNRAVWTLGRLRDPTALAPLEAVYTGELCEHDKYLCQYELEKAIKLCGGTPDPARRRRH